MDPARWPLKPIDVLLVEALQRIARVDDERKASDHALVIEDRVIRIQMTAQSMPSAAFASAVEQRSMSPCLSTGTCGSV